MNKGPIRGHKGGVELLQHSVVRSINTCFQLGSEPLSLDTSKIPRSLQCCDNSGLDRYISRTKSNSSGHSVNSTSPAHSSTGLSTCTRDPMTLECQETPFANSNSLIFDHTCEDCWEYTFLPPREQGLEMEHVHIVQGGLNPTYYSHNIFESNAKPSVLQNQEKHNLPSTPQTCAEEKKTSSILNYELPCNPEASITTLPSLQEVGQGSSIPGSKVLSLHCSQGLHGSDTSYGLMDQQSIRVDVTRASNYEASCKPLDNLWSIGIGSWIQEERRNSITSPDVEGTPVLVAIRHPPPDLYTLFDRQWLAKITRRPNGRSPGGPEARQHSAKSGRLILAATPAIRQRASTDGEMPDDDSDDETPRRQACATTSLENTAKLQKFACPFNKYDPQYFRMNKINGRTYRTCSGPGFEDVSRVKEHVYRTHFNPVSCSHCSVTFKTRNELDDHHRGLPNNGCEFRPARPHTGITVEMKERLQDKKRNIRDQADRWREMYRIIFAGQPIPSPYQDVLQPGMIDSQGTEDGDDSWHEHLRALFIDALEVCSQNMMSRSMTADFLVSVLAGHQWRIPFATGNANPTVPHPGFDTELGTMSTPKASASIWMSKEFDLARFGTPSASNHGAQRSSSSPLPWQQPVREPYHSSRDRDYPATCGKEYNEIHSVTLTHQRSSDSGYSTNSVRGPGNFVGEFDSRDNRVFSHPLLPSDSQPSLFSGTFREVEYSGGPVLDKSPGQNRNMTLGPEMAQFPWEEFLDQGAFPK